MVEVLILINQRPRWAPTGAAFLTVALVLAAVASAAPAGASPPGKAPGTATLPATDATVITLVTGDQITVTGTGKTARFAARSADSRSGFQQFRNQSGDEFIIPAIAYPYVGHGLDLSLFDVSMLLREGVTGAARIPLAVAGALPGVGFGADKSAFLTPESAKAFGAALRRRIGADVAAGRRPGSTPMPSVALGGHHVPPAAPAAASAESTTLREIELDETDETGAPANTLTVLVDVDSVNHFVDGLPIVDGIDKVYLRPGHYMAATAFPSFDAAGNFIALHQVLNASITVADSPETTKVTVDGRTATSPITVGTPRPAKAVQQLISFAMTDATGLVTGTGSVVGDQAMYVNPVPAPQVGKLHYVVQWSGAAADGSYRYDVAFAQDHGILANQRHTLRTGRLATVDHEVYGDPLESKPGLFLAIAMDPVLLAGGLYFFQPWTPQNMPAHLVDYVQTQPHGFWYNGVNTNVSNMTIESTGRAFAPGHGYRIEWMHGPLTPQYGQFSGVDAYCLACAAGGDVEFFQNLLGDSEPDHLESYYRPYYMTGHFTLTRDGAVIADNDSPEGAWVRGLPQTPATYVATTDIDYAGNPEMSQSTRNHTAVTIKYNPAVTPRNTLPTTDGCDEGEATGPCQVLPVLSLSYHLATDGRNTGTGAVQRMGLSVAHLSYGGHGSRTPIRAVTVSVSFDGGTTWAPAKVTGAAGHYAVSWRNTGAAGSTPSLRVTAEDAAGNAIDQTTDKAYTFGGSK